MAKHDMSDHIYDNTKWMKKDSFEKKSAKDKKHRRICALVLAAVVVLSLLANGVLAYLCFTKVKNPLLNCAPVTNGSNSDHEQSSPGCSHKENWKSINFCPGVPEQWFKGNGRFYVFISHNKTWNSSRNHCKEMDGELVTINSKQDKEFLAQRLCVAGESDLYWSGNSDGSRTDPDSKQGKCPALKGYTQENVSCLREERSICEIACRL